VHCVLLLFYVPSAVQLKTNEMDKEWPLRNLIDLFRVQHMLDAHSVKYTCFLGYNTIM